MANLKAIYPLFDYTSLEAQLKFIYSDTDFLSCATINEIIAIIAGNNLEHALSQVYKLSRLILTIGVTTSSIEQSFSRLSRLKSHSRNTMGQSRFCGLARIAIEREVIKELESKDIHDKIVEKCCLKSRRMEFLYK